MAPVFVGLRLAPADCNFQILPMGIFSGQNIAFPVEVQPVTPVNPLIISIFGPQVIPLNRLQGRTRQRITGHGTGQRKTPNKKGEFCTRTRFLGVCGLGDNRQRDFDRPPCMAQAAALSY